MAGFPDSTSSMSGPTRTLVRWGIAAGFGTCVVYPLLIFAPLPDRAAIVLAAAMGPLFCLASVGLAALIAPAAGFWTPWVAAGANALAGALLTAMLMVQLGADVAAPGDRAVLITAALGLDLAWDIFGGIGTLLFGVAMTRDSRFGRALGASGIALAAALLGLNLATAPQPPGEAGLLDVGPAVGLWYLVVTVMAVRALLAAPAPVERVAPA